MSLAQNVMVDMADDSGIAPKQTLELLNRQAGGRENLGFIVEDYRNYLRSKRTKEMQLGDTGGVLEYLQQMQSDDPSFTYAIQVDVDDLITNIFWADAKMKVDYDYFGDVVCFDTTYRKNRAGRPFAMFVGVNNHKQTLIFGAALLYDETAETFMWLFDTFVKTMLGKKPKSIFTDQDKAMAKALVSQWPETHHRLCIWHIYQNAAKHLKCIFEKFSDFAKDFSTIIYDYEDVEDFLLAWKNMLKKYELEDNNWLSRLFDEKEKWALVYGRETFSADITTTQRCESMNNSIKKYVSYKHDLLRFFRNFQRLVDDRRYSELIADFNANHSKPALQFPVKILRDAVKVYTPAVFKWFEVELSKGYDCTFNLISENGSLKKYEVAAHGKCFYHTVSFDPSENTITCSCKKFEFAGILCSHSLKVLSANDVKTIPDRYILKRWRKDIREQMPKVSSPNAYPNDDQKGKVTRRYRDLARLHTEVATIAAESDETYEIALNGLLKTLGDIKNAVRTRQKPPEDTSIINNATREVVNDDIVEHTVKGIKIKERITCKEDTIRPKNALEKLTRSKRTKKNAKSSLGSSALQNQNNTQNVISGAQLMHGATTGVGFGTFPSPIHAPMNMAPDWRPVGMNNLQAIPDRIQIPGPDSFDVSFPCFNNGFAPQGQINMQNGIQVPNTLPNDQQFHYYAQMFGGSSPGISYEQDAKSREEHGHMKKTGEKE